MEKSLVTVVVPVFNSEETISRTIESVLFQSYDNLELIIVNDGSNDNSETIIKKYEKDDSRVKYYNQNVNRGQSYTRNRGIHLAKGKYITFLDADDYFYKNAISDLINEFTDEHIDIIVCRTKYKTSKNVNIFSRDFINNTLISGEKAFKDILESRLTHTCWGKMYKTRFIKKTNIKFIENKTHEDLYTVAAWIYHAKLVKLVNKVLITHVRAIPKSLTNKFTFKNLDLLYILSILKEMMIQENIYDKYKIPYLKKYQKSVLYLINYGIRLNSKSFVNLTIQKSTIPVSEMNYKVMSKKEALLIFLLQTNKKMYFLFIRFYYRVLNKKRYITK